MFKPSVFVIGSGIGGLTAATLLQSRGNQVTVLEAQIYPGGCASTFTRNGFRFDSGATVVGGFQPNGPHTIVGQELNLDWPITPFDPAWITHLLDRSIALTETDQSVIDKFPETVAFWKQQQRIADIVWQLSSQGLPWPPTNSTEWKRLLKTGFSNFKDTAKILPFALMTVKQWLRLHGLHNNTAFVRFIDSQLLISAQTTSDHVNALYGAIALDLARQGIYHITGGIGSIAQTLIGRLESLGGEIRYRHRVSRIATENNRATGVYYQIGRHSKKQTYIPADVIVANTTPWNLDLLLQNELQESKSKHRQVGWGAFVLHMGVKDAAIPTNFPDHHQIITEMEGPLGETRSIFLSLSPKWDKSRAPEGQRATTITTHTYTTQWWDLLQSDPEAYGERKERYTEQIIESVETILPSLRQNITLILSGTPVTYNFYTNRFRGAVGGFPQTSLFKARSPRTNIPNLRLVGDSVFPGQSTAGVTLGALRVAADIQANFPIAQSARHWLATPYQKLR